MSVLTREAASPENPDRKRWTREECRQLISLGILEPGRYELLEGDIVEKMGQNEPHVVVSKRVFLWLAGVFGGEYVRPAAPVAVSAINEPEPDAAVTQLSEDDYLRRGTPRPEDLRLAVEVSDTTLRRDLGQKAALYAAAGVPEYWVIDINARQMHVHRDPTNDLYVTVFVLAEQDSVSPLAAPQAALQLASVLP
jgi:Uma2 family endonuclease